MADFIGTDLIWAQVRPKLNDFLSAICVPQAADVVAGDWAPAFQAAANRGPLYVPPRVAPYVIKRPIACPFGAHVSRGAVVQASPEFASASASDGASIFWVPSVPGGAQDIHFSGTGTLDGAGIAQRGVYIRFGIRNLVEKLNITNPTLYAVHVGAQDQSRSFEVTVRDIEAKAVQGASAATIGVFLDNASDCIVDNVVPIGFRRGFKSLSPSTKFINAHPWSAPQYGPMTHGFDIDAGGNILIGCYPDTPTHLGDAGISEAYGVYVGTNAGGVTLIGCTWFLNDKIGGVDVGYDDIAYAVYCASNTAKVTVLGGRISSSAAGKRWRNFLGSSNVALTLRSMLSLGLDTDGRNVAFNGANRLPSSALASNLNPAVTVRSDTSNTLAADSNPVQIWTVPLTAERTVTLPSSELYNGMSFRVIRGTSATGAFNLVVKNAGGVTLKSLSAAGQWAEATCDGTNWYLTAAGSL